MPLALLAARMQQVGESDGAHTVAQHLNRLTTDTSWQEVSGTALVGRLVDATLTSLTTPPDAPAARPAPCLPDGGPFPLPPPGALAPAEAAVPAHRQQTPGPGPGRLPGAPSRLGRVPRKAPSPPGLSQAVSSLSSCR